MAVVLPLAHQLTFYSQPQRAAFIFFTLTASMVLPGMAADPPATVDSALTFQWISSPPLVSVGPRKLPPSPDNPWFAVKDPTIVRYDGNWHLFATLRKRRGGNGKPPGYIRIGYCRFRDWPTANQASWHLLDLSMGYHAAPQVFFFRPLQKWFLVYQLEDATRGISFGPCYSTTDDISAPNSWTKPEPLYAEKPGNIDGWLDFWVICDETKAHLFFTSLNGKMWRAETPLADFPGGFGQPEVALEADIFEASHTYRVSGEETFLTIVEAQNRSGSAGRRYFKAFKAESLQGPWQPVADEPQQPFAGSANVDFLTDRWTDSISHGELIRRGVDERLEIEMPFLQMLYQGIDDAAWQSGYGGLGWQLGLLIRTQHAHD